MAGHRIIGHSESYHKDLCQQESLDLVLEIGNNNDNSNPRGNSVGSAFQVPGALPAF